MTNNQNLANLQNISNTPQVSKFILWHLFKFLRYLQVWISNESNYEWKVMPQGKDAWNKIKAVVGLVTAFCWQVSLAVTLKFIPTIQFCLQAKKASKWTQKKENKIKQAEKTVTKSFPSQQRIWVVMVVCV